MVFDQYNDTVTRYLRHTHHLTILAIDYMCYVLASITYDSTTFRVVYAHTAALCLKHAHTASKSCLIKQALGGVHNRSLIDLVVLVQVHRITRLPKLVNPQATHTIAVDRPEPRQHRWMRITHGHNPRALGQVLQ